MIMELRTFLRQYGLTSFYMALEPRDKTLLCRYSRRIGSTFSPASGSAVLWTTAANAIARGEHRFALVLLDQALLVVERDEDRAWIHANLAQLKEDMSQGRPGLLEEAVQHCRQVLETGHLKTWAMRKLRELESEHETAPF